MRKSKFLPALTQMFELHFDRSRLCSNLKARLVLLLLLVLQWMVLSGRHFLATLLQDLDLNEDNLCCFGRKTMEIFHYFLFQLTFITSTSDGKNKVMFTLIYISL